MWEAIQANRRKSALLIALLGLVLLALGLAIAESIAPGSAPVGGAIALGVWLILLLTSLAGGESILLASAGAREVTPAEAPQLHNVVDEMRIASGLPTMPRVCIVDSPVPNAFAVGLTPERSAVAVTTGLLARLNRYELQGVVGHEIGHIRNRDTLFLTLAGVTLGAIVMIADFYLRRIRYTAPRSRRSSGKNNDAAAVMMILAVVLALLAPLLAQLLYFACSRRREYLADASSALYTRYPSGLAGALQKIAHNQDPGELPTNRTLAPMYIVNPRAAAGSSGSLFSTHPPAEDRIRILSGMAGSFALHAYDQSFRNTHQGKGIIGSRSLHSEAQTTAPTEMAPAAPAPTSTRKNWRDAKEILHRMNGFVAIPCACGATLKLPHDFGQTSVECPRCSTRHAIPDPSVPPPLPSPTATQ